MEERARHAQRRHAHAIHARTILIYLHTELHVCLSVSERIVQTYKTI